MTNIAKIYFCIFLIIIFSKANASQNTWVPDKEISEIKFNIPVFLMDDVQGEFTEFEGYVLIDLENKKNNRALFFVNIKSIKLNYDKYVDLLLSDIFFDEENFPILAIDTKKYTIPANSNTLETIMELQIKNIVHLIPINITINHLTNNLVQLIADFEFSRKSYNLGKGSWSSTMLLRDRINVKVNLFMNRE